MFVVAFIFHFVSHVRRTAAARFRGGGPTCVSTRRSVSAERARVDGQSQSVYVI